MQITGLVAGLSGWQGPVYPNSTSPDNDPSEQSIDCTNGCLFDVVNDPTEHVDLASSLPEVVAAMTARLSELVLGFYNNNETFPLACPPNVTSDCACWIAVNHYSE